MKWRWLPLPIRAPLIAVWRIGRSAGRPVGVDHHRTLAVEEGDVALLQVLDALGQGRQRQGVGAHEHLVVAVADGQRAALAGDDQQILLALEQDRQREGALQPAHRRGGGLARRQALPDHAR